MARYQVILAYDGTDFNGFQRQASDEVRTVQGTVEAALRRIGWQGKSVLAAGRTDTGVHASGQVISFDHDWKHSPEDLLAAINANLPPDVAVRTVELTKTNFHPRFDALARCYHYRGFCQPVRDPLRERYAWRIWPAAELGLMQSAAQQLLGKHDFAAFGTPPQAGGTTIREIFFANWRQEVDGLVFEISANAFLYHMVRRLVGFQIAIGQGNLEPNAVRRCLENSKQELVRGLAPPQGLTLVDVSYEV
jgi:tRNA pseudouridine38-40 synthase